VATVLGVGNLFAARYAADLGTCGTERPEVEAVRPGEAEPADSPTLEALARVIEALKGNHAGLTMPELRRKLPDPIEVLARAIAAGLKARRLRRLGSRNTLRYVVNG
jgi:hypothetical protein